MTDQERDQKGPGVTPVDQHGWQPSGLLRLARLCRKELREIVRDRRTIFTLILMPLLAYPLLSMAFQSLVLSTGPTTGRVVVADVQTLPPVSAWLP